MAEAFPHVLINGLSIGGGGGYTVGLNLLRHLAVERPDWKFTLALISGHHLHEQFRHELLSTNCELLWAPAAVIGQLTRRKYENTSLARWASDNGVTAVVQLNGMIIPAVRLPTISHLQDPWAYRPEAWSNLRDRFIAMLKRREHAKAYRRADCIGWTSAYLRDLVTDVLGIRPKRGEVFYNGLPESWLGRARGAIPDLRSRPMEIVSVSNVSEYKRQQLVIKALPRLVRRPGLDKLVYRIVGQCEPAYREKLLKMTGDLGVADHVIMEGRVSDARLQEVFASARCYVLMSVCESFGIGALEAMTFGTPVVTSDCCAMPEVCGTAAELCPVDDVEALADRLTRVLLDAEHAENLRQLGRQQAQRFSWKRTAEQMADCLGDIMMAGSKALAGFTG